MRGFGKLRPVGAVFFLVLLVVGLGSMFSPAAARPTVGFRPEAVGEVVDTARARPPDVAAAVSLGAGGVGAGAPENKAKKGGVGAPDNKAKAASPLLLNVLARGSSPPSGPSPGINDVKT